MKKNKEKTNNENIKEIISYLNAKINKVIKLLKKGYDPKKIKSIKKLNLKEKKVIFLDKEIKITKDDLIELAKARIKAKRQDKDLQNLFVFYNELPFTCNENIAKIRAKLLKDFLKNKEFADLSCGFGIQSLYFLKYAKKAYFFEINLKKLFFAYLNSIILKVSDKIEFFNLNSNKLDKDKRELLKNLDFIYSDPGRGLNEKRDFSSLSPNPLILLKYNINYLFDLPPQMRKEIIKKELGDVCLEYIEFKGEINRLLVYSPSLKRKLNLPERRAIISENKIFEGKKEEIKECYYNNEKYLIEPFPSLVYAELIKYPIIINKRRFFILLNSLNKESKEIVNIAKNIYLVLAKSNNIDELTKKIIEIKDKNKETKVILRINIEDSKYYKLKKEIEEKINKSNNKMGKNEKSEKEVFYIIEVKKLEKEKESNIYLLAIKEKWH